MASDMAFLRRNIVMVVVVKFRVGLAVGFGLRVYFLPILIAETGFDSASIGVLSGSASRRVEVVLDMPKSDYSLYLTPKYVENGSGF